MTKIEDIKTALREMGHGLYVFLRGIAIAAAVVVAALAMFVFIGYCLVHYTAQIFTVLVLAGLAIWFLVELTSARSIREYEEQTEAWRKEKSKPAHSEVK